MDIPAHRSQNLTTLQLSAAREVAAKTAPEQLTQTKTLQNAMTTDSQAYLAQVVKLLKNSNMASVKILSTQQTLLLETANSLKPGQLVLLKAVNGEIKLDTNAKNAADQILRQLVPRQGSIKEPLQSLIKAKPSGEQTVGKIGIKQLVETIINQLPTRKEIVKPDVLRQLVQNGGLLNTKPQATSPQQTVSQANPATAKLGGLLQAWMPILKSLIQASPQQTNAASNEQNTKTADLLARIILSQFRTAAGNNPDDVDLRRTELLARNENQLDGFQVQFTTNKPTINQENWDREDTENEDTQTGRSWSVRLSFDFPELGLITAVIRLSAEKKLEMTFWSQRSDTFNLIERFREGFQSNLALRMETEGITDLKLEVFKGEAPIQENNISTNLINEKV